MGLGSGIQIIKQYDFTSPVSGGKRHITIGYSWSNGGQGDCDEVLVPVHVYAYQDEITDDVLAGLRSYTAEVAAREERPYCIDGARVHQNALDLAKIRSQVYERWAEVRDLKGWQGEWKWVCWNFTGYDPLADRIPEPNA